MELRSGHKNRYFIPEFNKNKELDEAQQIRVNFKKLPTASEVKSCKSFRFSTDGSTELVYHDSIILNQCVKDIENLVVDGEKIRTYDQLTKSSCIALSILIDEIRDYLLDDGGVLDEKENEASE